MLVQELLRGEEFVFFGGQGATLELWCDTGTGTVSVDFRVGRL